MAGRDDVGCQARDMFQEDRSVGLTPRRGHGGQVRGAVAGTWPCETTSGAQAPDMFRRDRSPGLTPGRGPWGLVLRSRLFASGAGSSAPRADEADLRQDEDAQ